MGTHLFFFPLDYFKKIHITQVICEYVHTVKKLEQYTKSISPDSLPMVNSCVSFVLSI